MNTEERAKEYDIHLRAAASQWEWIKIRMEWIRRAVEYYIELTLRDTDIKPEIKWNPKDVGLRLTATLAKDTEAEKLYYEMTKKIRDSFEPIEGEY